ncbi:MAG: hypothetical protein DCC75_05550 [Proteobacteria bacterium]|nr:MAG: hypothetical protein DCC75_05550 [Pseudomonadota bacterium]
MALNSKILIGLVNHTRFDPVEHSFVYPTYCFLLDIDEIESLSARFWFFGHNSFRPFAIHDRDFLMKGGAGIREKLINLLKQTGIDRELGRVFLVTMPRFFNYVFNPVNFYYCYAKSGDLLCHVVEINNTYGERHFYVLQDPDRSSAQVVRYIRPKEFFVSPFLKVEGQYHFSIKEIAAGLGVSIRVTKQERAVFYASIEASPRDLSGAALLKTLLQFPLSAVLTMPRIYWQAQILRYRKKLPLLAKPEPASPRTMVVKKLRWWEYYLPF